MSLLKPKRKYNTWAQNKRHRRNMRLLLKNQPILGTRTEAQIERKARSKAKRIRRKEILALEAQHRKEILANIKPYVPA